MKEDAAKNSSVAFGQSTPRSWVDKQCLDHSYSEFDGGLLRGVTVSRRYDLMGLITNIAARFRISLFNWTDCQAHTYLTKMDWKY
jgi:hypothetical protein